MPVVLLDHTRQESCRRWREALAALVRTARAFGAARASGRPASPGPLVWCAWGLWQAEGEVGRALVPLFAGLRPAEGALRRAALRYARLRAGAGGAARQRRGLADLVGCCLAGGL